MKNKRHLLFTQRAIELFDFCASTLLLSRRSIRAGYLILPVIFGLAFAQCAKNEFPSPTETMLTSNTDRKALMKDIIAQGGPAHAGGATLRSTTYTFSEAIDLLDETLNYAYCRPGTPLHNTIILSDTLIMDAATSTTVTEAEIADLFEEASNDLGAQYHALSLTNQQPWAFSVAQFGNLENDELPIIIQLEVAYGGYITSRIEYDDNDDYSYAFQGGMCNSTPGPGAPEILRNNLKKDYVTYQINSNKYFYKSFVLRTCNVSISDIENCYADGFPANLYKEDARYVNQFVDSPQNWDNINDWKLFRQWEDEGNYDKCLTGDEEMPFNEDHMGSILEFYIPGSSYYAGNIWVGSLLLLDDNNNEVPCHNMIIEYFKAVLLEPTDGPIELPDPNCGEC
ncbi:MAG: hypothetical protein KA479_09985 [Saprospiraceae bacterium]|nr:hypothetical protein [Saprospiraceae bacterium]